MAAAITAPKTLQQAILFFSDYENCRKAVESIRWTDGTVVCPHCGSERVAYLAKQRRYKCYEKHARAQFSLKVGTIFEDSAVGLEKWLPALWLLTNCKNGISSYELGRALGVTQKTAWFMLSRLRLALQSENGSKMGGEVEVDETYIGGKARNMHAGKRRELLAGDSKWNRWAGKVAAMGFLERGGRVQTTMIAGVKRGQLVPEVEARVEAGSKVYTDALRSYADLRHTFEHGVIDHANSYVNGQVHTNGLESYWSLLKRTLRGTYISVEPFHLFRYLDEQAFRFNERKLTDAQRFALGLAGILGKRLTYSALTGSELPQT